MILIKVTTEELNKLGFLEAVSMLMLHGTYTGKDGLASRDRFQLRYIVEQTA